MKLKTFLKGFLGFVFLFCIMAGIYAVIESIKNLSVFTVSSVEVKGIVNADRKKLIELGNKLVGMNIFDAQIEKMMVSEDVWVRRLNAERVLPSSINLVVFEEVPLFAFFYRGDRCYFYTISSKNVETSCENVKVSSDIYLNVEHAQVFADILRKNAFLKNVDIKLKPYTFEARIDGVVLYLPYDEELFAKNYAIYKDVLRARYKSVEYADLTIDERIFVKGEKRGSGQR